MKIGRSGECPDGKPYAVLDGDTVVSCHDTEEAAQAAMDSAGSAAAAEGTRAFTAVLLVEDVETSDGRLLELNGGQWRRPPLPLMWQSRNPELGGGHGGAELAGRIASLERDGRRIIARGEVADTPTGNDLASAIRRGDARFISADLGKSTIDYEVRAVDTDGWPTDVLARFSEYEIMGGTVVPFSAFAEAVIWLDDMDAPLEFSDDLPPAPARVADPKVVPASDVIYASGAPDAPPIEWFLDPELEGPTPLTITDDGRVFGHIALWGTCHIGLPGCTTAPRSEANYAYFRTGATRVTCEDGCAEQVPTGVITLGTSHADIRSNPRRAVLHYEHTGLGAADVAAGEDAHGIWVAGAVRPTVTEAQVRELRAAAPSGDWRSIGGNLELVAVLAVNVPGFPVPRPAAHIAASGAPDALVAPYSPGLVPTPTPTMPTAIAASGMGDWVMVPRDEWEQVRSDLAVLRPLVVDRIADEIRG